MPPKNRPPARPPKRSNTGMIVVIAVAAVAVLAVAVAVISQLGKSSSSLEQTQPVVVEGTNLPTFALQGEDAAVGAVPPTLEGRSFDGTPVTIDPGDGSPKLVVFAAHWCPHCQAEIPRILEWQQQGKIPAGLEVYGVATGTKENQPNYPPSDWLEGEGWTFPTIADNADFRAAQAWGLTSYPFFVALDSSGKVVARQSGELTEEQFLALVNSAMAAQ